MPIQVKETHDGGIRSSHGNASTSRSYLICGVTASGIPQVITRDEAYAALYGFVATNLPYIDIPDFRLFLQSVEMNETQDDYPYFRGECTWIFNQRQSNVGDPPVTSYSFVSGSARIVVPLDEQQGFRKDGRTPIPYEGIGWNGRGFDGVEIKSPSFQMNIKLTLPDSIVTTDYMNILLNMRATVNNAPYKAWQAGVLLYEGATIESRSTEGPEKIVWDVTHQFAGEPNLTNFTIGGINVPQKNGHDYLWASYVKNDTQQSGGQEQPTLQKIDQVNVAPVYRYADFTVLGIP